MANCRDLDRHAKQIGGYTIISILDQLVGPDGGPIDPLVRPIRPGTLGFLGTKNGDNSKNNIVLLSNNHTLASNGAKNGDTVYQPKGTDFGNNQIRYKKEDWNAVAIIEDIGQQGDCQYQYPGDPGKLPYYIDCAIARVKTDFSCCDKNMGTEFGKEIRDLNISGENSIAGLARVTAKDIFQMNDDGTVMKDPEGNEIFKNDPYKVYKVGGATGRTVGKIIRVEAEFRSDGVLKGHNIIMVQPIEINCDNEMKFADDGDSGAVLVNEKREIVGLLFGKSSDNTGLGLACHIHPVIHRLKITLFFSPIAPGTGQRKTNARLSEAPKEIAYAPRAVEMAKLAALKATFLETAYGRALYACFEAYRAEVTGLINRSRPVTLTWHRHHGPAFVAHFVKNFHEPDHPIPNEIKGISLRRLLETMQGVLSEHGSPSLRKAMARYADDILNAADNCSGLDTFVSKIHNLQTA